MTDRVEEAREQTYSNAILRSWVWSAFIFALLVMCR